MTKVARMVAAARKRRRGDPMEEEGFTLIELLVVLLIIGILLAIAIPTFLSVTKTANDTAAQSNLQSALSNGKTLYLQNTPADTYTNLAGHWASIDSGLALTDAGAGDTGSTGDSSLSVFVDGTGQEAYYAIWGSDGNCWGIVDDLTSNDPFASLKPTGAVYPATFYVGVPMAATTTSPVTTNCTGKYFSTDGSLTQADVSETSFPSPSALTGS